MRPRTELVEAGRHRQLAPAAIDERHIDRGSSAMRLLSVRRVRHVAFVVHESPHALCDGQRPVTVEDLQPQAALREILLNQRQPAGDLPNQEAPRHGIELGMGEVLRRRVAEVDDDAGDRFGDVHEVRVPARGEEQGAKEQ